MSKKTCFMVMPFGCKPTGLAADKGPTMVNYDRLWREALEPAISELGYDTIRADQDIDALIIDGMLQRLAYADLVIVDVSIANANVYYELGLRHAARKSGCVLIAADWAAPLFDIVQLRRLTYPLRRGTVPDREAAAIRAHLTANLPQLTLGESPFFAVVPHQEVPIADFEGAAAFRQEAKAFQAMRGRIHAVRALHGDRARTEALSLKAELQGAATVKTGLLDEMIRILRDKADWTDVTQFIDSLPAAEQGRGWVEEQYLLARAKSGDVAAAIGALEELVRKRGDSSEVCGQLGGRHKQLMRACEAQGDAAGARRQLDAAIRWYERGMNADLNAYYPSGNLHALLRKRGERGDLEQAIRTAGIAVAAAERALRSAPDDRWARHTLLGAAFGAQEPKKAAELATLVAREGAADWELETTLADLRDALLFVEQADVRDQLTATLAILAALLPG